jgi:hypothetical protein
VQWKRENCPPFEKPPLPTTSSTGSQRTTRHVLSSFLLQFIFYPISSAETKRKREADGADTSAPVKKERKIRLGNTELNRLWSFAGSPLVSTLSQELRC